MNLHRRNLGLFIIVILTLIPVYLWFSTSVATSRFGTLTQDLRSLGQLASLTGIVLFSLNILLSIRLVAFEKYFGGLNRYYNIHHNVGIIATILLMLHPLFLVYAYIKISFGEAAKFLLPGFLAANTYGQLALFGMVILVALVLYTKPKYQLAKLLHSLMGVVFGIALIHVMLVKSDVSTNHILRIYILGIGLIAFINAGARSYLKIAFNTRYKYQIQSIKPLTATTYKLVLSSAEAIINYKPGQFAFMSVISPKISAESHPFSFVSQPSDDTITFVIKDLGDYTKQLSQIAEGTTVYLEGPFGEFGNERKNKHQIWIAGGIGVTPFISLAKVALQNPQSDIELYYTIRNQHEVIYGDFLQNITTNKSNFKLNYIYSETQPRLTAKQIQQQSELTDTDFYICAPGAMIASLRQQLINLGVKPNLIHSEEFILL